MKTLIVNNFKIFIGNSAIENWSLLDNCCSDDLFFHLSSFPSCYVILKYNEENLINEEIIQYCCKLCKENTKFKNVPNLYVDYTYCSNIIKGEKVGELIYISRRQVKKLKI